MATLKSVSEKVAKSYSAVSGNNEAAFDPSFIMVIAELLVPLIQAFMDCRKPPEDVPPTADNPGPFQEIRLNLMIRREFGNKFFRENGYKLKEALRETGGKLTKEEVRDLYKEVDRL